MVKARPILFQAEMVRAILSGKKTQTRRIIKPQPARKVFGYPMQEKYWETTGHGYSEVEKRIFCPYGKGAGDVLWVRETWSHDAPSVEDCRRSYEDVFGGSYGPYYRATEPSPETLQWKPSIHMPKWASRITLEIVGIVAEQLQDISEEDAQAEGVIPSFNFPNPSSLQVAYRKGFYELWEKINGEESLRSNPWVWVIEFKPHLINVNDYMERLAA